MKKTITRTCEFYVDEHDILHAIMLPDVVVDYEDALDNFLVIKNLTNSKPMLRLIDLTGNPKFLTKAKKLLDNKEVNKIALARAIVTSNAVKKVSFNFFIKLNASKIPTKFFTNYSEAIVWLRTFKDK
ncbi:MAG: hypothetical protein Q8L81_09555 [Bacteroidota bacterium]|nr:hypothetical protein [Bacteroidota bacterium]